MALILRGWSCKDRHTDGSVAFRGGITYFEGMKRQRGEPIYAQRTRRGPSDALSAIPVTDLSNAQQEFIRCAGYAR